MTTTLLLDEQQNSRRFSLARPSSTDAILCPLCTHSHGPAPPKPGTQTAILPSFLPLAMAITMTAAASSHHLAAASSLTPRLEEYSPTSRPPSSSPLILPLLRGSPATFCNNNLLKLSTHTPRRPSRVASNSGSSNSNDDAITAEEVLGLPAGKKRQFPLPASTEESVSQARQSCQQAIKDGKTRMMLEIILPLIGATDLDDWPGGIEMQFKAGAPLVSNLLRGLLEGANARKKDGGCRTYIIDDSDAVGGWESDEIAAVLFPTPETLDAVEKLASVPNRPLLLVNAQWQPGQVISDFGFGARKKSREDLVSTFEVVYFLKRSRILGEDVCLMRRYPSDWQVFVIDEAAGTNECVGIETERPSYKRLQEILKSRIGSKAGQGWFDRLVGEFNFNKNSLKNDDN